MLNRDIVTNMDAKSMQYVYPVFTLRKGSSDIKFLGGSLRVLLGSKEAADAILTAYESDITFQEFLVRKLDNNLNYTNSNSANINTNLFNYFKHYILTTDLNITMKQLKTNINYKQYLRMSETGLTDLKNILNTKTYYTKVYSAYNIIYGASVENTDRTKMTKQLVSNIILGIVNIDHASKVKQIFDINSTGALDYSDAQTYQNVISITTNVLYNIIENNTLIEAGSNDVASLTNALLPF